MDGAAVVADLIAQRDMAAARPDFASIDDLAPEPADATELPDGTIDPWVASTCPGWKQMPDDLSFVRNFRTKITLTLRNETGKAGSVTNMSLPDTRNFGATLLAGGSPPWPVPAGG